MQHSKRAREFRIRFIAATSAKDVIMSEVDPS
jgi:hypothetical protein